MTRVSQTAPRRAPKPRSRLLTQRLQVRFDYPVVFTHDALNPGNPALLNAIARPGEPGPHRMMAWVDKGFARAHPSFVYALGAYVAAHAGRLELAAAPLLVAGGEGLKRRGLAAVEPVLRALAARRLCRHSVVLAVGGGAVLDTVGLAASLAHRGLRLVRMPTTVVAQADVGVGVKNGLDMYGGKNFAGTFWPPFAVVNDLALLESLSDVNWRAGISEAFKVAIIKDRRFFRQLARNASCLGRRDSRQMARMVRRCAELHLDHIARGGDPFEMGTARPLDFGHWSAHQLEILSGYRLGHGQAVAIGVALDATYARRMGWLTPAEWNAIVGGLRAAGLPIWSPLLERRDARGKLRVFEGLDRFREHLGGELTLTMPRGIGQRHEVHALEMGTLRAAIGDLKAFA